MNSLKQKQAGVTVFELTIVLVLTSLVLGSILPIHSLVEKATARRLVAEMVDVKDMLYLYRDRYNAIPGDDFAAHEHMTGAVPSAFDPTGGFGGDGLINDKWAAQFTLDEYAESGLFWNHVRKAGLAAGNPGEPYAYNAVRGRLGISSVAQYTPVRPAGIAGLYNVCSSGIAGKVAKMMDIEMDDGNATTGKVWAAKETNSQPVIVALAPTPYLDVNTYTVCMAF